jgi:hypothetical protein
LVVTRPAHVVVELTGEHTTGMTVTDFSDRSGERNVEVGVTLGRTKFWDLRTGSIAAIGEPGGRGAEAASARRREIDALLRHTAVRRIDGQ